MRFLVTMEHIDTGDAPPPREMGAFLENVVLPSVKMLGEWEKAGKARAASSPAAVAQPSSLTSTPTSSSATCCAPSRSGA